MALNLFLVLSVYYILKVVREPLILLEGGVAMRNAARGAQAALLLFLVPLYGWLLNRRPPRTIVTRVLFGFLLSMLAFPLLSWWGVPVGFAFFVWLGIFSITALAQLWSLANDLFSEEAGKRVFSIVAAGGTLGGLLGAQLVALLTRWLDPMQLILLAALIFSLCVLLTRAICALGDTLAPDARLANAETPTTSAHGGFTLILGDPYLLLIAGSVILLNLVNTTGDQVLAMIVQAQSMALGSEEREQFLMGFYASFQTWVGLLTALMQVLTVARIVRTAGMRTALLAVPVLAFGGYGALALFPALGLIRVLKIVENSAGYSLQNTVQQMLFLPTSRSAKYKAKSATDTFFVRLGDLCSWAVVTVALAAGWGTTTLALVNVVVAALWVVVAALLGRGYAANAARRRAPAPHGPWLGLAPAVSPKR